MAERPIIFSTPMVKAILAGRKTQTRRVAKPQPLYVTGHDNEERWYQMPGGGSSLNCYDQPYQGGDTLWVRETCRAHELTDDEARKDTYGVMARLGLEAPMYGLDGVIYVADGTFREIENSVAASEQWCALNYYRRGRGLTVPAIHMPRWASRITLGVKSVRVERLQEISRGDSMAEGCPFPNMAKGLNPRDWFAQVWDSLNEKRGFGWQSNPWVWVVEFEHIANG